MPLRPPEAGCLGLEGVLVVVVDLSVGWVDVLLNSEGFFQGLPVERDILDAEVEDLEALKHV